MKYRVGKKFKVPSSNTLNGKAFEEAMLFAVKPKHGRPSWLAKLSLSYKKTVYDLLHEGKTLGEISTYVLTLPCATRRGKKVGLRTLQTSVGLFGEKLEEYFKDIDTAEQCQPDSMAMVKQGMVTPPETYLETIDPKMFQKEYLKSATVLLRNAANLEARIEWLSRHESSPVASKYGRSFIIESKDITTAQKMLHDIHKDIMLMLKDSIKPVDREMLSEDDLKFLFNSKEQTEKLAKASTILVKLLKNKSIPLVKDSKGRYQPVGGKGDAKN